jgi:XRE family transcriptional regulator, regulator of sulfur utilization
MILYQQIAALRKSKGLTQEELASRSQLTVRTIQRIESGESVPRSFTLKAIANALDIPFEYFNGTETQPLNERNPSQSAAVIEERDAIHSLQLINLSSFFYLIIPYIHFLVPNRLLKKSKGLTPQMMEAGRQIVRQQAYWVIALNLLMFLTLAYNLILAPRHDRRYFISYLWPFLLMYFLNAGLIFSNVVRLRRFKPVTGDYV